MESHESFTLPQCTFTRRHGRRELFCSYIAHRGRTSTFNGGKASLPSEIIELELESFQPATGFCFYKARENADPVATKGLPGSYMSAHRKLKTIPLRSNSFIQSLRSPWFCSPIWANWPLKKSRCTELLLQFSHVRNMSLWVVDSVVRKHRTITWLDKVLSQRISKILVIQYKALCTSSQTDVTACSDEEPRCGRTGKILPTVYNGRQRWTPCSARNKQNQAASSSTPSKRQKTKMSPSLLSLYRQATKTCWFWVIIWLKKEQCFMNNRDNEFRE